MDDKRAYNTGYKASMGGRKWNYDMSRASGAWTKRSPDNAAYTGDFEDGWTDYASDEPNKRHGWFG